MKNRICRTTAFLACASALLGASPVIGRESLELTLEESVLLALEKSHMLAGAHKEVLESKAKVRDARTNFFPQISNTTTYTRLDEVPYISLSNFPSMIPDEPMAGKIAMGDDDNYSSVFTLTQPLFTGFRVLNGYRMASYAAQAQELTYGEIVQDVILHVYEAYYGVLKAQEFEKVSDRALEQIQAHVRDLENMYEVGIVAENDLLKAKVQLSEIRLARIKAKNGVRLAKTMFCSVVGLPLDSAVFLNARLEYSPSTRMALVETRRKALESRPRLKAMAFNLNIAQKGISIARAQWLPSVSLIGNYNLKKPNREYELEWYDSWDLTIAAQMDIFDWGARYFKTSAAKHRLRQLQDARQQLEDGITLEVTQNYLALDEAEEKIGATEEAVDQAEENYRVTQDKFKQGMVTNTDMLDANSMLTSARMQYIRALADYHIAQARLERAMGILRE